MKISIFGMGYVGAVSGACLARDGHDVIGVDLNPQKLALIREGTAPILEEGIQELTRDAVRAGRLAVTGDAEEAVHRSEVSFLCVGTPSSPNGSQDVSAVIRVAESIGKALRTKSAFHAIVLRSTVPPGTLDEKVRPVLEACSGKRSGADFGLCFQPEFLREGTSIRDYDNPPFTVVGSDSDRATGMLRGLFGHLPCEFIATDVRTAEALKMACNAFHALKITFANEIGRVTQALGVDSRVVMDLLCKDQRLNISRAYLRPGFAFGGSCLPKDLKALTYIGRQHDVETPLLSSILPSNRVHVERVVEAVLACRRRRVGLIGLSFKPGTDDLRESPLVTLAERLIGKGLQLAVYDPEVNLSRLLGANKQYIEETIPHIESMMVPSAQDAVGNAEVVIVGHGSPDAWEAVYRSGTAGQVVIDLAGGADRARIAGRYWGVCW